MGTSDQDLRFIVHVNPTTMNLTIKPAVEISTSYPIQYFQMRNPTFPPFFFLFLLLITFCHGNQSLLCPEIEKQALLTFKHSLNDSFDESWNGIFSLNSSLDPLSSWNGEHFLNKSLHRLSSWNGKVDCCKWSGVVCNNLTSHVHELRLSRYELSGKLHTSLLNLKHLTYLDLSWNGFIEPIPSFIGSFTNLEHLDLSNAGFYGTVPPTIGNLSSLRTLRLESNSDNMGLNVDNLEWLSTLSQLEELSMDSVNLSRAISWEHVINALPPSLVKLSIRFSMFDSKTTTSNSIINITNRLTVVDLSSNRMRSSAVLSWIFQIPTLISLDLSVNDFEGPIPTITNISTIQNISLYGNLFNSSIPNWISSCKDLEVLYLHFNQLTGPIPTSLGNLSSLTELSLHYNKLTGNLPQSLGQLSNLEKFGIGENMLEGVVTEMHFANLTKLHYFGASGNHLTLKVNPNWVPPFNLSFLQLASWNVGTVIPSWTRTQKSLISLDLSKTGIYGTIPAWIWNVSILDLSNNQLHGPLPSIIPTQSVNLNSNKFTGALPRITENVTELNLSNNSFSGAISHLVCGMANTTYGMLLLHLGNNELSGALPDCWMNWTSLRVLHLGNNNISGNIPASMGGLSNLESLNMHSNRISGHIPFSMLNCTKLQKIDFSNNDLKGSIPIGMGTSLGDLVVIILRSNKLSGELSSDICHLNFLRILDLSDNKFSGRMPSCIGNFTAMVSGMPQFSFDNDVFESGFFTESAHIFTKGHELQYDLTLRLFTGLDLSKNNFSGDIPKGLMNLVSLRALNLSENRFTGSIPYNIGNMKQLESLDLSRNSLSGGIPTGFTDLSFLSYLDLSYNNLTGRIPECTQLRGLDPSRFVGNNLCGPPLTNNCSSDRDRNPKLTARKEGNESKKSEVKWLYVFMSLGYSVGFSAVCSVLVLNKSWRKALFGLVEEVWDAIYVHIIIKWRRLARRCGWKS